MNVFIKHERFMDVAIELHAPIHKVGNFYVVNGKYVNQGFVETFELGVPATIKIPESKINQWQICRNPLERCIRNSHWTALLPRKDVL